MAAAEYGLTIEQGSTFRRELRLKNSSNDAFDLTGYECRGALFASRGGPSVASFVFSVDDPATGVVEMSLPASATAALRIGVLVYSVEIVAAGGDTTRLLRGSCEVV